MHVKHLLDLSNSIKYMGWKKKKQTLLACIFVFFIAIGICVSAKVQMLHQKYKTVNKK